MKLYILLFVSVFAGLYCQKCYHCNDTKCDNDDTVDCKDQDCITVTFNDGWIEKGCVDAGFFEVTSYCDTRKNWHGNRSSCASCGKNLCNDK